MLVQVIHFFDFLQFLAWINCCLLLPFAEATFSSSLHYWIFPLMIIWVFFKRVFNETFLLAVISASNSWPGFLSWISSNSTWQHYTATAHLCLNLLSCWTRFQSIDFIGPLGGFWWTRSSFWICKTQCLWSKPTLRSSEDFAHVLIELMVL